MLHQQYNKATTSVCNSHTTLKRKGIKGPGRKYILHYKYAKRYRSLTQLAKKSEKTLKNRNTEDTTSKKIAESIPIT
jgi:hypothetical protein